MIYLVEFDNVWVVEQLHHLHLPVHLGQVGRIQLGLIYDLDGNLRFENGLQIVYIEYM